MRTNIFTAHTSHMSLSLSRTLNYYIENILLRNSVCQPQGSERSPDISCSCCSWRFMNPDSHSPHMLTGRWKHVTLPALSEERHLLAHHKVQVSLTDQVCPNVTCAAHFRKPISLVELDKLHSHHLGGTKFTVRNHHSGKTNHCAERIHTLCNVWTKRVA